MALRVVTGAKIYRFHKSILPKSLAPEKKICFIGLNRALPFKDKGLQFEVVMTDEDYADFMSLKHSNGFLTETLFSTSSKPLSVTPPKPLSVKPDSLYVPPTLDNIEVDALSESAMKHSQCYSK